METNPHILNCFKSLFHPHLFFLFVFFVIVTFIYPRSVDRTPCFFLCNSIHTYGLSVTYIYICDSSTTTMYPDVCLTGNLNQLMWGPISFLHLPHVHWEMNEKQDTDTKRRFKSTTSFAFLKGLNIVFAATDQMSLLFTLSNTSHII